MARRRGGGGGGPGRRSRGHPDLPRALDAGLTAVLGDKNDLVKIDLLYKVVNDRIIATQEVKNKKLMIYPSDFDEWNKPMKAIQPYYNESVVLEKK